MTIIDQNDLVVRNFLILQEDSQRLRARIVKDLDYYEGFIKRDVFTCNKILDYVKKSEVDDLIE